MATAAASMEASFVQMYRPSAPAPAIEFMTAFMEQTGQDAFASWLGTWMRVFAKFRDGGIVGAPVLPVCVNGTLVNCTGHPVPSLNETGYVTEWRGRIVHDSDNAARYLVPPSALDEAGLAKAAVASGKARGARPRGGAAGL